MTKSPVIAFVLSIMPGWGHVYIGNVIRGFLYFFLTIALIVGGLATAFLSNNLFYFAPVVAGLLIYAISFLDIIISLNALRSQDQEGETSSRARRYLPSYQGDAERFFTIILSFFPGLGHFQLGLMNRGLTFMVTFFGMAAMIFFVTILLQLNAFLLFSILLPVVWIYSFVDAIQMLARKQNGETLVDQSVLEDLETRRKDGKKSTAIATILSIFPGAGHLYLGLQHRGIQLMAAFLFTIYILDALRLGLFLFLIPLIWFYSFFDGMQKASRYGKEELYDEPVFGFFHQYKRWLGIGLIFIGIYYLLFNGLVPALAPAFREWIEIDLWYWFDRYFQTILLSVVLVIIGIKLLKKKEVVR
ncbi:multi-TM2 domain-containing protein [Jeotgalibacillus campisalis]|uniref:Multi-TM2 domain-containing protein n=1 Tax=Jeotgalibacillus campisalis TaxID=220754 RepID=A0A0C2VJV1_9BACL|nr:multi-TM2 domain-containing protein [Jeotgalibacillus campisalis]KIL49162.1 hypothetical protein KR50_11970 [Jeotgalibacillus campisalis]